MQYPVPQFIDVQDKVVGPLTIRQFLWLLGGAGISLVLWLALPTIAAVVLTIPVVGLAALFAFYKMNGIPFYLYLANLIGFALRAKLRIWKRTVELDKIVVPNVRENKPVQQKRKIGQVNLDQLVYILNHELAPQAQDKPVNDPFAYSRGQGDGLLNNERNI